MVTTVFRTRSGANAALALGYFILAAAALTTTRFGGGVAYIWVATALLLPAMGQTSRRHWTGMLLWCAAASALATGLFGLGWTVAAPLAVINVGEALIGALLLRNWNARRDALDSVSRLALFAAASGIVAPVVCGFAVAGVLNLVLGLPFVANWLHWSVAHSLGVLSVAPICSLLLNGTATRWLANAGSARLAEASMLMVLVAATTVIVFAQDALPILFITVLPIMLSTFRLGGLGGAAAVVIVAVVGGALTISGHGPIGLVSADPGLRAQFFQFYLAVQVLTALPVAADLTRRSDILRRLRQSEARLRESEAQLRLLTDNSTDIVLNLSPGGRVRFASPSIAQLGGYAVDEVIGRNAIELVEPDYRDAVTASHKASLDTPGTTQIVEYRAMTGDGALRWFETHSRAIVDGDGVVSGVVCAIRDVTHRKSVEDELARAAATDPLTGLANRRVFDAALERQRTSGGASGGHVALFDLDHFKGVNDRFGHAAGDAVLKTFARVARACVREGDLVARLGGEEFGIVLANAGREQAHIVCERLRAAFAATPTEAGGLTLLVTASAGVAAIRAAVPVTDTLEQADTALYEAKRTGRNRLLLAA